MPYKARPRAMISHHRHRRAQGYTAPVGDARDYASCTTGVRTSVGKMETKPIQKGVTNMLDLIIERAKVYDGTGNPWRYADVGIRDKKIEVIGRLENAEASERLDATGLAVAPGFLDIHTHTELAMFQEDAEMPKIMQGVTTELYGHCSLSVAPLNAKTREIWKAMLGPALGVRPDMEWPWLSVGEYLAVMDKTPKRANLATLVGHGTLRSLVMGFENREPSQLELTSMQSELAAAMEQGAFGMSSAGVQSPSNFASHAELTALATAMAPHGGVFMPHLRSESNELVESVVEAIAVSERSGAPLHLVHMKAAGTHNWGKVHEVIRLVDEARARGVDVTMDQYPYIAGSLNLEAFLPPWVREGGHQATVARLREHANRARITREMEEGLPGWESLKHWSGWEGVTIASVNTENNRHLEGMKLEEIARQRGVLPEDALFDIICEEGLGVTMVIFWGCEEDLKAVLAHPVTSVISDSLPTKGKPHPRLYGTFPRVLGKYAREEKCITMEEAVKKMTSLPASRLGLTDRGILRPGAFADVVVFDSETVSDISTYDEPRRTPAGIRDVLVNGEFTVRNGVLTQNKPGMVIRNS